VETALRIARQIVPAYRQLGGLAFAYGQGSVFTGYDRDAVVDIVVVWDRDAPPPPTERPVHDLSKGPGAPVTLHQPGFVLDHFALDDVLVDVSHQTREAFEGWLREVRSGRGWEGAAYPLPLYAVSGFAYGALLADGSGAGSDIRSQLPVGARGAVARGPRRGVAVVRR
jgi:hypothetical protein